MFHDEGHEVLSFVLTLDQRFKVNNTEILVCNMIVLTVTGIKHLQ